MGRFYFPNLEITQDKFFIEGEEAHHITGVMRKNIGDRVEITNGEGLTCECELIAIKKFSVECSTISRTIVKKKKPQFYFLIPVIKNPSRFEFMLEKLTELGVNQIIPFISEKSLKVSDKHERWTKVLISAMKQSHEPFLPVLHSMINFDEGIDNLKRGNSVIFHGDFEGETLEHLISVKNIFSADSVYLIVGPEGDFSEREKETLSRLDSIPVKLSDNRLRSETAAITLLSLIKNLFKGVP